MLEISRSLVSTAVQVQSAIMKYNYIISLKMRIVMLITPRVQ